MSLTKKLYEKAELNEIELFNEMMDADYQYEMWKEKQIQQYAEYYEMEINKMETFNNE